MPISLILALLTLIAAGTWIFFQLYNKHYFGNNAPEKKAKVTILDKQAIVLPETQPGQEDQQYWIYVQRGMMGPKREFQVGIHYYQSLMPGDKGLLTYCGDKFLHFALER